MKYFIIHCTVMLDQNNCQLILNLKTNFDDVKVTVYGDRNLCYNHQVTIARNLP